MRRSELGVLAGGAGVSAQKGLDRQADQDGICAGGSPVRDVRHPPTVRPGLGSPHQPLHVRTQTSRRTVDAILRVVNNYSWPADGRLLAERSRLAWGATVAALPVGAPIAGEVIGRQPFGVFIRIDGAPDAVGLAEVTTMPRDRELPAMGSRIAGTVISHAEHNHQVRMRLANW